MNEDNKNLNTVAEGENGTIEGATVLDNTITLDTDKSNTKKGNGLGIYAHEFRKPFEYEGKKYKSLNFYFEQLTGRDMINIENEMQANNEYALDPLLSRNFQSKMAARAAKVGTDVLEAMPIQEFNKIVNAARNFLIDSGY